jgi:hypothetical protein
MTTDDTAGALRERLVAATRHVSAPSGIAERATAGGRRRLRRRRLIEGLATTAAALAAVAVVLPLTARDAADRVPGPSRRQTAPADSWSAVPPAGADVLRWLYDRPPRGDLVRDAAYVRQVVEVWDRSHATSLNASRGVFRDLRGPSRVVWAGRTPAGPAAVVVQRAVFLAPAEGVAPGVGTVVGFVGVDAGGRPRLVADGYRDRKGEPGSLSLAWFVDPDRSVVAVLDLGAPVAWAQGWRYHANGVRDLDWTRVAFRDGAATVRVDGSRWWDVHVARQPFDEPTSDLLVARDVGARPTGTQLRWGEDAPAALRIAGLSPSRLADPGARFIAALHARIRGAVRSGGYPLWNASGRLPDGTEVVVADSRLDGDPSHAYAVLSRGRRTSVVHGGPVDPDAPLPVVVGLPDGRGTVVARERARLEWRSAAASGWRVAGTGAALVPADATQVRVTPAGEAPVVVELPAVSR